jgi:hypothetical protein
MAVILATYLLSVGIADRSPPLLGTMSIGRKKNEEQAGRFYETANWNGSSLS